MQTIREQIGEEIYTHLEAEAKKKLLLAMQFVIIDKYRQEHYYYIRSLLTHLIKEFQIFEEKGFKFTPIDIVRIIFESKLLYPCQSEKEYTQRGGGNFMEESPFIFLWEERNQAVDVVINNHLRNSILLLSNELWHQKLRTLIHIQPWEMLLSFYLNYLLN